MFLDIVDYIVVVMFGRLVVFLGYKILYYVDFIVLRRSL